MSFILFVTGRSLKFIQIQFATKLLHFTEYFYTGSIRFLLSIQPWLICKTNLPNLPNYSFFIKSKCQSQRILFVANHRSNLDTFLLISLIPGLRGLAKNSLYYNFFFAPFMWITGFVPVEKGSGKSFINGLEKIRINLLEKNIPVVIYPENTRCEKGSSKLNKWSQAVFKTAIDSKATIIPIAIKNTDQTLGRGDLFLTPFQKIEIKMLEPVETVLWKDSFKLANCIHQMLEVELK